MAATYTCDGCGSAVEKPTTLGHATKRDYCEICAPRASSFVKEEERARAVIQSVFAGERQKLIDTYGANGFKLPDVLA